MGILKNKYFRIFIVTFTIGWTLSCQKMTSPSNPNFFLKTFQTGDTTAIGFYVKEMSDGGFLLISTQGESALVLSRTNKSGRLIWSKTILKSGFYQSYLISSPPWIFNVFNGQNAGQYVVQSGDDMESFDTTGTVSGSIFNIAINSEIIRSGTYFIGPSDTGLNHSSLSSNIIFVYDQNMNLKQRDTLADSRLGAGKVLQFFVNGVSPSGAYRILGSKYPVSKYGPRTNIKLFAALVPFPGGKCYQTIVDSADNSHSDIITWQTTSADSDMILLGQRTVVNSSREIQYPVVVKFDKNLNIIWEKDFPLNSNSIIPNKINLCRDGGFIIVGSIANATFGGYQSAYALKIDQNGNKQWDKTITSITGTGSFAYGTDLSDGGFAFVGESSQFGKGKAGNLIFFVRTDKNGNY